MFYNEYCDRGLTLNKEKATMLTMKVLLSLLIAFYAYKAEAKPCHKTIVAVLDTGFGYQDRGHEAKLCRYGHKDFSIDGQLASNYSTGTPIPMDINSHGTNIVGIIDGYARKTSVDYCIVIIKYYSDNQSGEFNQLATTKAIQYATSIGANFINYSSGGKQSNGQERLAIKDFIDKGGSFIAAAGNERSDLDIPENSYYPAMEDKRIVVVGSNNEYGVRSMRSNYGSVVDRWEVGENVTAYGITMTGTSQATAVATGKMVSETKNKCSVGRNVN